MGEVLFKQPQFLVGNIKDIKFRRLMFIKKGGTAIHKMGSVMRNVYDAELICVSNEDENNWIGNYAEGFGLYGVKFKKTDCRDATEDEAQEWLNNPEMFKYN